MNDLIASNIVPILLVFVNIVSVVATLRANQKRTHEILRERKAKDESQDGEIRILQKNHAILFTEVAVLKESHNGIHKFISDKFEGLEKRLDQLAVSK